MFQALLVAKKINCSVKGVCLIPFFKKKFRPPLKFFFLLFFTIQTILSRFRPKKIFKNFFPQGGRAVDPVLGEKNFWKFFFGLNRLKMVWNVKKAKKNFRGPAPPPLGGGGQICFPKMYPKTSLHAKIQLNRSSHLFRDPLPPPQSTPYTYKVSYK